MQFIDRETLKRKLERGDQFKLVMTLPEWDFALKHIPGSICVHSIPDARRLLRPEDQIIVYSSCPECPTSHAAARLLEERGYSHVWHYLGGVIDWEDAGFPLEGTWAHSRPAATHAEAEVPT
jgi:rhodanese-related sulfurtransferase